MAPNIARDRCRGFTLAESMIASVLLAAAVVGISGTLASSYQQSAVRGNLNTALGLASQLMEEIGSRPLSVASGDQPGWDDGQTDRAQYDTIDDYDGYSDVSSSVSTRGGTPLDLGDGGSYTRTVEVETNAKPVGLTGSATDFVKVTVTVQMPQGQTHSVCQLFTRATLFR